MTERYAEHDEEDELMEGGESPASGVPLTEAHLAPLIDRIETLERRLDELTGEAETALADDYDSGEA
jgi:hypothetical protein